MVKANHGLDLAQLNTEISFLTKDLLAKFEVLI